MLWGGSQGGLQIRSETGGAVLIAGRFPYGVATVLVDGGRSGQSRKEQIAPRAFSGRVDRNEEIHLLVGHDFDRPIASRGAQTLRIWDSDDALLFEARISETMRSAPYVANMLAGLEAGLIRGLSPGFRIADEEGAETVRSEGNGLMRTVHKGDLFELSVVTVPAYAEAQIDARSWKVPPSNPAENIGDLGFDHRSRWRL